MIQSEFIKRLFFYPPKFELKASNIPFRFLGRDLIFIQQSLLKIASDWNGCIAARIGKRKKVRDKFQLRKSNQVM